MNNIALLGASGSIGRQTLDVIRMHPDTMRLYAVAVGRDTRAVKAIAEEFRPKYIAVADDTSDTAFFPAENTFKGETAAASLACLPEVDTVVNAVSGFFGLRPFLAALESGKTVAAANKESIVCAHALDSYKGGFVAPYENGARVIPVDSEQSAIFQCLEDKNNVESIILTASGGAFIDKTAEELVNVTVADALCHPTWSMGKKITIDSATLFNKGLEVMEAAYLFDMSADNIEVVIHKQSIVHSLVRFKDGSIKAQLGTPDMRMAIQYALTYPKRIKSPAKALDLTAQPLAFIAPDRVKYPALDLAYSALRAGGAMPIVYNGANEKAVELFMAGQAGFTDIARCVEYAMNKTSACLIHSFDDIISVDKLARVYAAEGMTHAHTFFNAK